MHILGRVTVLPNIPEPLSALETLANNLYWTWTPSVRSLFRRMDPELWEASGHTPTALLRSIDQQRLDELSQDTAFVNQVNVAYEAFRTYLASARYEHSASDHDDLYAYFCAEYGWHEGVALYSGGLGVLAGDHTKAASDLGVPLVGVGLWYPEGYFHQRIAADGTQTAVYIRNTPQDMGFTAVVHDDGTPVEVNVRMFGSDVSVRAWRVDVGRVPVYLLDVDHEANTAEHRGLLTRLYGGDTRTRIAQEMILGIAGVRLLRELELVPTAWHMNEGHSAFLALERMRELVADGMEAPVAREAVRSNTAFTVHTPVAAGNDAFSFELVDSAFDGWWRELDLSAEGFHELGTADHGWGPVFSMPALALRMSSARNGVAELHGETSRKIWHDLWLTLPVDEVPIGHVTNGVHVSTWMAPEIQNIIRDSVGAEWTDGLASGQPLTELEEAPYGDLWSVRCELKERTIRMLRRRIRKQRIRHEASPTAQHDSDELLNPNHLTIGFARRFATYKRATLIFSDLDRLERILSNPYRPVQLVFAGKAHPADQAGQALIERIDQLARDPRFAGRIVFAEDYDMALGRALTQGVDVWLNNPRRPLEASGTSGQKAAMNGVLNLSILDGWWPEGFNGMNGWAIGNGTQYQNDERADEADADALYDLLEREVVPLYYERDAQGIPAAWLKRSLDAISSITPQFNAQRMVRDYVTSAYAPATTRWREIRQQSFEGARTLATFRDRVRSGWATVSVKAVAASPRTLRMGEPLTLTVELDRGSLADVPMRLEVVYSAEHHRLERNLYVHPIEGGTQENGLIRHEATITPEISGPLVFGVRAYPTSDWLANPLETGIVCWAS